MTERNGERKRERGYVDMECPDILAAFGGFLVNGG